MKLKLMLTLLIGTSFATYAQQEERRDRFPVGIFHKKNQNINGLSIGLYSGMNDFAGEYRNIQTNGIRLEAVGLGLLVPLLPNSPIAETDNEYHGAMAQPVSERINGFNLSPAGTVCDCQTNGVSAGFIGQINRGVSGVSISMLMNFSERNNGVQMAMFNESYAMNGLQIGLSNTGYRARGIQIGLVNHSKNLKGIQLGLWNVNQKRKMPFINWNFNGK